MKSPEDYEPAVPEFLQEFLLEFCLFRQCTRNSKALQKKRRAFRPVNYIDLNRILCAMYPLALETGPPGQKYKKKIGVSCP